MPAITRHSFKSYVPLIPWLVLAAMFGMAWAGMHFLILGPAEEHLSQAEAQRIAVRQQITSRQDAKETAKDMSHVIALLPTQRDFAQLPQTISEEALHEGVILPGLSYSFEKPDQSLGSRVILRGPVTGRYEDLRRFIYGLETANRLVFIEDLDVSRSGKADKQSTNRDVVTVNLQISTYIRKNTSAPTATPTSSTPAPGVNLADDKRQKEVRAR
ncbi:MAG: type 4a pilus biogenesis protein PilO [Nitrospirota bacterium]